MGDFQGHPFRGNQYSVGQSVGPSDSALRRTGDRVGTYGAARGDQLKKQHEEHKQMRGVITKVLTADADNMTILRKKGDFVGYEVKWDPSSQYPQGHVSQTGEDQITPKQADNAAAAAKAAGYPSTARDLTRGLAKFNRTPASGARAVAVQSKRKLSGRY